LIDKSVIKCFETDSNLLVFLHVIPSKNRAI
jgi:hypothetical protein